MISMNVHHVVSISMRIKYFPPITGLHGFWSITQESVDEDGKNLSVSIFVTVEPKSFIDLCGGLDFQKVLFDAKAAVVDAPTQEPVNIL